MRFVVVAIAHASGDVRHDRERRIYDDDAGDGGPIEVIVDLGGVEARDGDGRKGRGEQIGAGLSQLIQDEIGTGDCREDREQARACRWLQHPVGGSERCGGTAARPSGVSVKNCCRACASSDRRVWVGSRPAI